MFTSENPIFEFRGPFGVPVQISPSLIFLVFLYVGFGGGAREMAYDLMFLVIVMGSIFLHEVGHAWGSLVQGQPVRRIVLNGCGGFCERERSATRYEQELIVAMGPIVNAVLWAVSSLIAQWIYDPEIYWVFATVAWVNLSLLIINLLPITPLDGSKLFNLLLCRIMSAGFARRVCGFVGLLVAGVCLLFLAFWLVIDPLGTLNWWLVVALMVLLPAMPAHWRMLLGRAA
ncbi:hypothetical protein AIOL_002011 [Candidatus Rhodobacter oscarellae]|uniref:Peptidase M50 domain-containing protein n=1 Tax=Candidatus Rhodobacter oscarellae TaxID=1675527 RepID=A0A0J9GU19_9RHOB|nr:site-2 protease family protein [Candidatus Rhodobacter lobularis]KMW57053.1 hypothetical protein AIOL_002011 [Candidatus Rhodobacter lobularis]